MVIYILSTSVDLADFRAAVAVVLRQMGHEVIGMEEYVAEGARPLDRCLKDVERCDVYVGIFAWRYGHTPTKQQAGTVMWPQGSKPGETSITECEFRAAVPKKPLVFVLDPAASWAVSFIDAVTGDNESGQRIQRLREELFRNWLAGLFRTPEDLARQVAAAVHRRELHDRIGSISLTLESGFAETAMTGGPIEDSTLMSMQYSLSTAPQLSVLRLDLRDGRYWWSTRLFFLACVAEDIAATRLFMFTDAGNRLVGAATPATVRDRLARSNEVLRSFEEICRKNPVDSKT